MISTIKNNFYLILCTRLSSFFHHATSDHSPCCSFNRIQTVYVVYVCVYMYVFINDHFKTRILWSLCMYVRIYVSCVSRSLFIRSSFISLSSSLSRNAQWQSVEIDVFYLELVLLFFVLRRILELARQCWLTRAAGRLSIDVEGSTMKRGLFTYFCPLKQQSNDLKILINLKNVSS